MYLELPGNEEDKELFRRESRQSELNRLENSQDYTEYRQQVLSLPTEIFKHAFPAYS